VEEWKWQWVRRWEWSRERSGDLGDGGLHFAVATSRIDEDTLDAERSWVGNPGWVRGSYVGRKG
jgi:hypothetical protein